MHITFSPQRRDGNLVVSKQGDALTISGTVFDFSAIPDGATLPASAVSSDYLTGNIERIAGVLHLTLVLPHGAHPSSAVAFPAPLINPPNGALEFPQ
ncbi:MAG: hypothetical protein ABJA84_01990 [Polaromonas sp.]